MNGGKRVAGRGSSSSKGPELQKAQDGGEVRGIAVWDENWEATEAGSLLIPIQKFNFMPKSRASLLTRGLTWPARPGLRDLPGQTVKGILNH